MSLLTSLTNIKRALQKFVVTNIGKVLAFGIVNGVYWVKYTVVRSLQVSVCVTFVSVKWLRFAFVELRKTGSAGVVAQAVSPTAYAVDGSSGLHFVHVEDKKIDCTCPDFENQIKEFGKGCCKHAYAILNHLGYGSLRDFVGA